MISEKALNAAQTAYDIEAECIAKMKDYFEKEAFSKAVELLCAAPRIGTAGCGHSGTGGDRRPDGGFPRQQC